MRTPAVPAGASEGKHPGDGDFADVLCKRAREREERVVVEGLAVFAFLKYCLSESERYQRRGRDTKGVAGKNLT